MSSAAVGTVIVEDTDASTPDMKILRANLYTAEDAEEWFKKYGDESCTSWIVNFVNSMCTRMVYHKVWDCHLSHRNKTRKGLQPSCPARLDIKVKMVTFASRRNDRFLRQDPPLPAVIRLIREHNHPVGCPDAPRSLRPTAEARARFEGYFESGMTPAQAIHHNKTLLAAESGGQSPAVHGGSNPRDSAVYTWHRQWRRAKYGLRENPLPKLQERAGSFAASGTDVHTCGTGDRWAVLVVTPIMRRAQQLQSARELVFVDSVLSCDETKSTVTCLLAPSKAGAVPIAVLIHNEQSSEGYQMAFDLLRSSHPLCFGGREFPAAFVTSPSRLEKRALSHVWPRARQLLCHMRALQSEWRWLTDAQNGVPKSRRPHCLSAFQKILKARGEEELARATEEAECDVHDAYMERINDFVTSEEDWSLACHAGVTTLDQASIDYSEASVRVLKDILLGQVVAWNAVVLIDFVITELETYLEARLLRHIDPREAMCETTYEKLLRGGEAQEKKYRVFASRLRKAHELAKNCPGYLTLLDRIIADLKGVDTSSAAYNLFLRVGASSSLEKRRRSAPTIKRPRRVLRTNLKRLDGTWAFDAVSGLTDSNSCVSDASDTSNAASHLTDTEMYFSDANDESCAVSHLPDAGVSLSNPANDVSDVVSHVMDTEICPSGANCASDAVPRSADADVSHVYHTSTAVSCKTDADTLLSDANDPSNAVSHVMDTNAGLPSGNNAPQVVSNSNDTNVCLPDASDAYKVTPNLTNTNVCFLAANDASNAVSCSTSSNICLPDTGNASKAVSYVTHGGVGPSDGNGASGAPPRITLIEMHFPNPICEVQYVTSVFSGSKSS
ncbi:uncharacterized protein LOC144175898 isoform X2 [Haemaphysalis longicornis]